MDYVPCPTLRLRKRRKENAKRAENPPKVRSKTYDLASQKHTGHVIENGAKHSRARTGLATVTLTLVNNVCCLIITVELYQFRTRAFRWIPTPITQC